MIMKMKMLHRQNSNQQNWWGSTRTPTETSLRILIPSRTEIWRVKKRPRYDTHPEKMISKNEHRVSNGGFFVLDCFQNFKSRSTAATVQMDKTTRKYVQLHLWDEYKFAFTLHLGNGMPCKSSRKKLLQ